MADKPFSSIIDAFLADREPSWDKMGLEDAKKSGDEVLDRTHDFVDQDFIDEIAESASKHTAIPPSKSATLQNRLYEKEKAAPQVASVKSNWHKDAVRSESDELMDEVTMSLEQAASEGNLKENSADKKEISDSAIQTYIRNLLNSGTSPSKVAAKIEKLAEIELFNKGMATDYLQRNAGMLGLAYLEPNTFMDKESPTYGHNDPKIAASWRDTPDYLKELGEIDNPASANNGTPEERFQRPQEGLKRDRNFPAPTSMVPNEGRFDKPQGNTDWREMSEETQPLEYSKQKAESGYTRYGSNECVRQHNAFKQAGIRPLARSVKQIRACEDCSFFKKDASGKRCNLYHLPIVANAQELSQIVNNLTPGVPLRDKRAALVQIADRMDEHVQPFDASKTAQTNIVKTADAHVHNQAARVSPVKRTFTSSHLAKLHDKGVSLQNAYKWADKKFGSVETSVAFRGFVQTLRKNEQGRIVVAAADLKFLNSIGIRGESFEGGVKCASCPKHFQRMEYGIERQASMRVDGAFAGQASDRNARKKAATTVVLTAAKVRTLHQKGHSLEKIFQSAAAKVGSLEAKKVVVAYVASLRKLPARVTVNASDRSFLVGKLSVNPEALRTLESVRRPTDKVVATVRKQANSVRDGYAVLNEYELAGPVEQQDIDVSGPNRLEIEIQSTFSLDDE
jgi:hypothetical protein